MDAEVNLKTYRVLQILGNRFNEAYSMFTVHATMFATGNLVVGIYGTTKFVDCMPFDKYLNFPLMVVVMLVGIFTFYIKNASIYQESCREFENAMLSLTKNLERFACKPGRDNNSSSAEVKTMTPRNFRRDRRRASANAHIRRLLAKEITCTAGSCRSVGIPFGSFYFIKQTTALNILNFICCNSISTLITYP